MFCSGCGTQIQSGLNYCSRCGRRVAEDVKDGGLNATPQVVAAFTAGAGFLAFVLLVRVLTKAGIPGNQIIPITFVYFAALLGICFFIIRSGSTAVKEKRPLPGVDQADSDEPAYLSPANTARLSASTEMPASVVEHTTRSLEETSVERR